MRKTVLVVTTWLAILSVAAGAQDGTVLEVSGRGAEGKPAYDGGGVVKFLDASIGAQIVHNDPSGRMSLPLCIRYEVLEPAPIMLTSRLGTEYWRLYSFDAETMTAMYADEKIELVRRMGIHGYCLFAYSHLSDEQLRILREVLNTEPAVPYFRDSQ